MTDPPNQTVNVAGLRADLAQAQLLLAAFAEGPAKDASDAMSEAFEKAGSRIATSLGRAFADGEVNVKKLAKTILEELAKIALPKVLDRIGLGEGKTYFGARAAGGAVTRGGSYLVGERGPELFTPSAPGSIGSSGQPLTITVNVAAGADAAGFLRHRGQIAAEIARAVVYGRRNL
jgi:phage-related minor tail protein